MQVTAVMFKAAELIQGHASLLPTALLQQARRSSDNFRSCKSIGRTKASRRPQEQWEEEIRRRRLSRQDQLGGKRAEAPSGRERAEPVAPAGDCSDFSDTLCKPAGRLRDRRQALTGKGALDQSGLSGARKRRSPAGREPSAPNGWAWRARGRTGLARSPARRGAVRRSCPSRVTHAASPRPETPLQPEPVLAVSRQPRAICTRTCTWLKRGLERPLPDRRPWRRSARGPSRRSSSSRQKGSQVVAAGRDIHWSPGDGNPRGELRVGAPRQTEWGLAGQQAGRSGQAKVEVSASRVPPECPQGLRGGSGAAGSATPRRALEAADGSPTGVRASAPPSPGYATVPRQTPDGKGGRDQGRLLAGRSPSAASWPPPASRSSFSKCRNFSQAWNPVPRGHGGSPPAADVATPPGCWRCT